MDPLEAPLHRDDEALQEKIAQTVEEGRLVVVGADGDLHWSDRIERAETMPAERLDQHPAASGRSIDEIAGAS
jgi:hypothetical protein